MSTLLLILVGVVLVCRAMTKGGDDDHGDPQAPGA
jgi:hypothetical protein